MQENEMGYRASIVFSLRLVDQSKFVLLFEGFAFRNGRSPTTGDLSRSLLTLDSNGFRTLVPASNRSLSNSFRCSMVFKDLGNSLIFHFFSNNLRLQFPNHPIRTF